MKKYLFHLFLGALFLSLAHIGNALAVEVAPRISDREIIERLTGLEEGQKRLEQRMDAVQKQLEQRMEAMQKQLEHRMEAMRSHFEQRMNTMQSHFEQRMEAQWNLTLVMIAGIFGLIGFVVWDRKTALKPLERRFARIAHELERDLDVASPEGSRLPRLIAAAREFAPDDPRLAGDIMAALERHSLLTQSVREA